MKELKLEKKDFVLTTNTLSAETLIARTKLPACGSCRQLLPQTEEENVVSIHLLSGKIIDWDASEINLKLVLK